MSSKSYDTSVRPADSLKEAKILSRDVANDTKWVHLEAIKWKAPNGQEVLLPYTFGYDSSRADERGFTENLGVRKQEDTRRIWRGRR